MDQTKSTPDFILSLIAGSVNGIIFIVSALAFASLIFTGPLSAFLPQGIGILLVSSALFALFSAFTSSHPAIISSPQDIPIAILALMSATVISKTDSLSADHVFQFMFVAIALSSLCVGLFFFLLGRFKLGKLVRFIPFPVVGGFLAGTGWLIVRFSFSMMTDMDLSLANVPVMLERETILLWIPGLLFGLGMLFASRHSDHHLIAPGMILGGMLLFHGVMYGLGVPFEEMERSGHLLGPFPSGGLFPGLPHKYVPDFQWSLFLDFLPEIGTMVFLNAIALLFNYSGLELILKRDFDLDKELQLTGVSNILAGFFGATPGYLTLSETTLAHQIGVRDRLANITVAALCLLAVFFGAEALSIFPKLILGGLLLQLGCSFLVDCLYDTWNKVPKSEYLVIVVILISIGTIGFLKGIVIGLMLSMALFVINYSTVEVVKHELTGRSFHSNVERSEHLTHLLDSHGNEILVLPLQGFIFFGTANRILERVQERIDDAKMGPLRFLIFDFRQTTGVDSSTMNCFQKLELLAEKIGFKVLLSGVEDEEENAEAASALVQSNPNIFRTSQDLDHALEWCEEKIIAAEVLEETMTGGQNPDSFHIQFQEIAHYFTPMQVESGVQLIQQGQDAGGLYFIEKGRITVQLETPDGPTVRLKTMGSNTVVGEVSLYLQGKASASVVTNLPCEVFHLSMESFIRMNQEVPEEAAQLHTYVVRLLSNRLASTNKTIHALMD
jgi:sulfate permease, SulP family